MDDFCITIMLQIKNNFEKIFGISIIIILIIGTVIIYSTQQVVNKIQFKTEINAKPNKLFDILADVQNYPEVFPVTFVSVKILNQTHDTIYAEETISYQGITRLIEVKHVIQPSQSHTIKILSGEFVNSSFIIEFDGEDSNTILSINGELYFPAYLGYFVNSGPGAKLGPDGLANFRIIINTMYKQIPKTLL